MNETRGRDGGKSKRIIIPAIWGQPASGREVTESNPLVQSYTFRKGQAGYSSGDWA